MRRKSIGATSQAFHEPMSTGAFLEFLTRLGCRDAGCRKSTAEKSGGPQGPVGQVSRGLGPGPPGLGARPTRGLGPFPHKNHSPLKLRFFANLLGGAWRRRGCRLKRLLRRWGPGGKRSRDTPPTPPPPPPPPPGAVREKGRGFSPSPPSATIQHAPQGRRIPGHPSSPIVVHFQLLPHVFVFSYSALDPTLKQYRCPRRCRQDEREGQEAGTVYGLLMTLNPKPLGFRV